MIFKFYPNKNRENIEIHFSNLFRMIKIYKKIIIKTKLMFLLILLK